MGMQTPTLRGHGLRRSAAVTVFGTLVALAGCAAQPQSQPAAPAQGASQAAAAPASRPVDFHTLNETKCPTSAASY
ncbi:MAG TPA: hypothetical protein PLR41_18215, partial [Alphaproteobacteria bacterium]|nr:hypothetical protein [Alphaproteobacteria bacterium]